MNRNRVKQNCAKIQAFCRVSENNAVKRNGESVEKILLSAVSRFKIACSLSGV